MKSLVKNFQIQLPHGKSRCVAATRFENIGQNLIFYCGDRIVLLQPKEQVLWFREHTFPQSMARTKGASVAVRATQQRALLAAPA